MGRQSKPRASIVSRAWSIGVPSGIRSASAALIVSVVCADCVASAGAQPTQATVNRSARHLRIWRDTAAPVNRGRQIWPAVSLVRLYTDEVNDCAHLIEDLLVGQAGERRSRLSERLVKLTVLRGLLVHRRLSLLVHLRND